MLCDPDGLKTSQNELTSEFRYCWGTEVTGLLAWGSCAHVLEYGTPGCHSKQRLQDSAMWKLSQLSVYPPSLCV